VSGKSGNINYVTGDATDPKAVGRKIIAHICNDIGAWGKGFVLAVSRRWPKAKEAYQRWHEGKEENHFALGAVQFVQVREDIWVANMIAQRGIRRIKGGPPIRYEAVEGCLGRVAEKAWELGASVHMPRIGCGLAGGKWPEIEPIIEKKLCSHDIPVYVYDLPKTRG
jgi:O-acetyl-ADP-ribose deacetylase (regulator of RNase III)